MHKVYYWYFQLTGLNWLKDRVVWREKNDQSTAHITGQNMRRFLWDNGLCSIKTRWVHYTPRLLTKSLRWRKQAGRKDTVNPTLGGAPHHPWRGRFTLLPTLTVKSQFIGVCQPSDTSCFDFSQAIFSSCSRRNISRPRAISSGDFSSYFPF